MDRFLVICKLPEFTEEEIGINKLNVYLKSFHKHNAWLSWLSLLLFSIVGSTQCNKKERKGHSSYKGRYMKVCVEYSVKST